MTSPKFSGISEVSASRRSFICFFGMVISLPVASASTTNAAGGTTRADYRYSGLRTSADGRGLLGFSEVRFTDSQTGITASTTLRQDWPYVGLRAASRSAQSSGALLKQARNTLGCTNPASGAPCTVAAGNRYFPFVSQSVESGVDLNGAALPTVTTSTNYDPFGNATSVTVSTGDGHAKTTTNTYSNDAANWLLGRLVRSTVQSTAP